jgi:uncharacterized protein YciI
MLYALICTDKEDGGELRQQTRAAHLEHLKAHADQIRFAGPFTSEDGSVMTGSLLIVEAASLDEAKALAAKDPYAQAGLFASVDVRPWRWTVGNPDAQ